MELNRSVLILTILTASRMFSMFESIFESSTEGVVKPLFQQDNFANTFAAFLNVCEQQDDGSGLREVCQWARGLMTAKGF